MKCIPLQHFLPVQDREGMAKICVCLDHKVAVFESFGKAWTLTG
jgi:hypothetical protein